MNTHLPAYGLCAALALAASGASAAPRDDLSWVGSWHASPQPRWQADFPFPTNTPFNLWDQTVRQTLRLSVGGEQIRVVISNEYGNQPLHIGSASVALTGKDAAILEGSSQQLRFGGQYSVSVPPGAPMYSDPVDLHVPAGAQLSISLYLPRTSDASSFHWEGLQSTWLAPGDVTTATQLELATPSPVRLFLRDVQVRASASTRVVVALGDSITDGAASTPGLDHRWTDYLARRMAGNGIAVLNAGISGGRVLRDRMGSNALARFDRDVLSQPQLDTVIVLMGINDISWHGTPFAPDEAPVGAAELIAGYRQLITRAKARGVRIVAGTLTPFEGALPDTPLNGYYTTAKEGVRQTVNRWIREGNEFDAIIDFDALLRDPGHPTRFLPAYDSGDHLHPGDAGYEAMAAAAAVLLETKTN